MDDWNSDLLFHVVQYLNLMDMAKFSRQSRRIYYLIHQYRLLRGPQLISVASNTISTSNDCELYEEATSKLQCPPNLALSFTTVTVADTIVEAARTNPCTAGMFLHGIVHRRTPDDAVVLGVIADTIQTTGIHNNEGNEGHSRSTGSSNAVYECQSQNSLMMLAGLPENAVIQPFLMRYDDQSDVETFVSSSFSDPSAWKMFIIHVVGDGIQIADSFIHTIQTKFPNVTIVGGVCSAAYVSITNNDLIGFTADNFVEKFTKNELFHIISSFCSGEIHDESMLTHREVGELAFKLAQTKKYRLGMIGFLDEHSPDGICGVALADDIPVRSVVSRGVESLTSKYNGGDGVPTPSTSLYVHESELIRSENEGNAHLIHKIRDDTTGYLYTAQVAMNTFGIPDFIGLRFSNHDGFTLETPRSTRSKALVVIVSSGIDEGGNITGANVDFFDLSGKQCMTDMTYCMEQLQRQTNGEEILGAIMFSCNGRGPHPGILITESMADAKRFATVFPNVPCLGYYAGGEIGPSALAGRQSVFQQGNACLQGFTAVFALFIVPPFHLESTRSLDDSDASVTAFFQNRWKHQQLTTEE